MSPIPEPNQKHVPAWKKLGLKLKFAKEEPEDTQSSQNGSVDRKKRKAPAQEEAFGEHAPVERSAKKARKSKPKSKAEEAAEVVNGNGNGFSHEPREEDSIRKKIRTLKQEAEDSTGVVNGNNKPSKEPAKAERPSKKDKKPKVKTDVPTVSINRKSDSTHEQESSPPPALRTTPASKRKSVSFTPDTKTKDGDSVKSLYKTWIANQIATDPSFDPLTVSPALRSIVPSVIASPESPSPSSATSTSTSTLTSEQPTKDNKRPPKKPKRRLPKTSSGPGPSRFDPVLNYLTTHHTSPQTWKFSKPHQNQILKHLFSLNHIPSSYDTALLTYIHGLKGTSARSRVRKEALTVREGDENWLAAEPSDTEKMENETVAQCIARRRRDYEAAVARIKQTLREKEDEREERDWELLGEKAEWEERVRKRRRAEIVLWNVGEKEEAPEGDGITLPPQQDTFGDNAGRRMKSGMAQLAQAARDPGPAPRVGRGVGMGMGGVEVIDAGGIARGSRGRKVVFGDDGAAAQVGGMSGAVNGSGGGNGVNGARGATTGVKKFDGQEQTNGVKLKRKRKRKRRTGVPDDDDSSSSSSSDEREKEKKTKSNSKNAAEDDETSSSDSGSGTSSSGDSDSD